MADELDCDLQRVPTVYELDTAGLSTESKMHWATCYYINDVTVSATRGIRVFIRWRIPRPRSPQDVDAHEQPKLIEELITSVRKKHIDSEFGECLDYLVSSRVNGAPAYRVELLDPSQITLLEPLPEDVADLIRGRLEIGKPSLEADIPNLKRLPAPDQVRSRAFELVYPDLYRMHIVLEGGLHTDTFLRCRALVTNREYCSTLVEHLVQHYGREGINAICAIGTSALTMAVLLAQRLGSELTFTFGGAARKDRYDEFEWKVHMRPHSTVLLIDDILAQGHVAIKNIDYVKEFDPQAVHYFALFSLGSHKPALEEAPDVSFTYLYHKDDVHYWEANGDQLCDECRDEPLKRVWEYRSEQDTRPETWPVFATYPSDVRQYYGNAAEASQR